MADTADLRRKLKCENHFTTNLVTIKCMTFGAFKVLVENITNLHVVIDSRGSEQKTQQCQIYVTEHQLIGEFSSILPALFQKVLVNYNY